MLLQTLLLLGARSLWYSDEIRYGDVLRHVIEAKKWIVLSLNGVPYPDKPPVYFWFLAGLHALFPRLTDGLFHLGVALSGLCYLYATLALGQKLFPEQKSIRLVAGLLLVTTFYFLGLTHYSRMDILFGAFILLSQACIFLGLLRAKPSWHIPVAFLLAGLATLTKGPYGVLLPILSLVSFAGLRGQWRKLIRWDVLCGVAVFFSVVALWAMAAILVEGRAFIENIIVNQIVGRAVQSWRHSKPFYYYLLVLPGGLLPWSLSLFFLPWSTLSLVSLKNWHPRRLKTLTPGIQFLLCSIIPALIVLSLVSSKMLVYLLPLFGPLSLMLALHLDRLDSTQFKRLFQLIGILLAVTGIALFFANRFHPWPTTLQGLVPTGTLLLLLGTTMLCIPWRSLLPGLLTLAVGLSLVVNVVGFLILPSVDPFMTPKAQAQILGDHIRQGYTAVSYKVYSGTYSFYAQADILETNDRTELKGILDSHEKVIIALRLKDWDRWPDRPDRLHPIHTQWIVSQQYILATTEPLAKP